MVEMDKRLDVCMGTPNITYALARDTRDTYAILIPATLKRYLIILITLSAFLW